MDVTQNNPNNGPNGRKTMLNKNGTDDNPNKERVEYENMSNDGGKIDDPFALAGGQNGHDPGNGGPDETPPPKASRNWTTGDEILGRYKVIELLGQGGMGVVYRCKDLKGNVEVAVKALPPEVSHSTAEMEEVQENYSLVSKLVHTNIAVYKTLEMDSVTGDYYLVMEYVGGEDLRHWMKRMRKEGNITLETALPVLRQIAVALDYAHGQDVIHRDMKPDNVKIMADGTVKVLDFGLAAQIRTSLAHVSKEEIARAGTNLYKSPEQWQARSRQGAAADQYSLAVTAYELLAGHVPFESDDMALLKAAVLKDKPELIDGMPKHVNDALQAGLAKEASGRYATCVDFVRALGGEKVSPKGNGTHDRKGNGRIWLAVATTIVVVLAAVATGTYHIIQNRKNNEEVARKAAEAELARQREEQARKANQAAEEAKKKEEEAIVLTECKTLRTSLEAKEKRLRQVDRGQMFGRHLDNFEKYLKDAEDMVFSQKTSEAIGFYKKAQGEAAWLEQNMKPRQDAKKMLEEASTRKTQADRVGASQKVQDVYQEAERYLEEGKSHYESARFTEASSSFAMAAKGFEKAVKNLKDKQLEDLVGEARDLSEKGGYDNWARVYELAEKMVQWDAQVAVEWREKAEVVLRRPRLELKAFVNNKEVNAVVKGTAEKTPLKKEDLLNGNIIAGRLFYQENGNEYEASFNETVNWTGNKILSVKLERIVLPTSVMLPDGIPLELVEIKAGSFWMGSPTDEPGREKNETRHHVTLTRNYCLGKYEVTQRQWKAVMGTTLKQQFEKRTSGHNDYGRETKVLYEDDDFPMMFITWYEAMEFCQKLTEHERRNGHLNDNYIYTLPTEAQWEFACRAGTETALYNGALLIENDGKASALDEIAWYRENSSWKRDMSIIKHNFPNFNYEDVYQKLKTIKAPKTVGTKKPNSFGLYDILGNIQEWCRDNARPYSDEAVVDPIGPLSEKSASVRGGSHLHYANECRSATRYINDKMSRFYQLGFRVALVPVP